MSVEGTTPSRMSNFEVEDVSVGPLSRPPPGTEIPHATHYEVKWRERGKEFSPEHAANLPSGKDNFEIALPSGGVWVVRVRACNVNLCGPAVSEALSVTTFIQVPQFEEIQNLRVSAKKGSWFGYVSWDVVERATYYNIWYVDRDNPAAGMVPHRYNQPNVLVSSTRIHYSFDVPGAGRWDFVVKACDDDGCFALGHAEASFDEPVEQ